MKYIVRYVLLCACMLCSNLSFGQTYNVQVGETLQLNVPSVPVGYVDKAIWACANPAITFISKSEISATIEVTKKFDGYATIELVYVERYQSITGHIRANTYYKEFYVSCVGGSGDNSSQKATSILIQPEISVEIGEKVTIPYQLLPAGSAAEVWVSRYPGDYIGISHNSQEQYVTVYAGSVGIEKLTVYFYDENDNTISSTCMVTVYDPTWTSPESISVPSVLILSKDEEYKILPSLYPQAATTLYEWDSGDRSIVSVSHDSQGTVKARGLGITDVTVKTLNDLMAKCTVVVVEDKTQHMGMSSALKRTASMLEMAEDIIK